MNVVSRAIIIDKEGRVLLGKRARGPATGSFALIGGKPERDENPKDTVIREVREEIGLDFMPIPYLEMIDSNSDPASPWMVHYFTGSANGHLKLKTDEIETVIFVSEKELDGIEIAFDHRERLKDYFKSLI